MKNAKIPYIIQKQLKSSFFATFNKTSIDRNPTRKLIITIIIIVRGSINPKTEPSPKIISTTIDARATGTDIRKLSFNVFSCSQFSKRITDTVIPEREIPGKIENP